MLVHLSWTELDLHQSYKMFWLILFKAAFLLFTGETFLFLVKLELELAVFLDAATKNKQTKQTILYNPTRFVLLIELNICTYVTPAFKKNIRPTSPFWGPSHKFRIPKILHLSTSCLNSAHSAVTAHTGTVTWCNLINKTFARLNSLCLCSTIGSGKEVFVVYYFVL